MSLKPDWTMQHNAAHPLDYQCCILNPVEIQLPAPGAKKECVALGVLEQDAAVGTMAFLEGNS